MVSSEKRQRHKEGHRSRMEAARQAQAAADKRRRIVAVVASLVVLAGLAAAGTYLTRDDGEEASAGSSTSSSSTEPETPATVSLPEPPPGRTIEGETPCPGPDETERVARFSQAPPMCITQGEPLEAVVTTSAGVFTVALDTQNAPIAANNFVVLARYRFFDGLPFHRLIPEEYAQTGSSGDPDYATGGPGYDLPDGEVPAAPYADGDLAMAVGEAPSGSQWFVVLTPEAGATLDLDPKYPRVGAVVEGLEVVQAIGTNGTKDQAGSPTELITIESVEIRTPEATDG